MSDISGAIEPHDLGIGILFGRVREAVVVADVDTGLIVLWNPAAEKIFGYHSRDRASSAAVDPDRTLLLDLEQSNNSKTIGLPRGSAATRWAKRCITARAPVQNRPLRR